VRIGPQDIKADIVHRGQNNTKPSRRSLLWLAILHQSVAIYKKLAASQVLTRNENFSYNYNDIATSSQDLNERKINYDRV
jgi:hypothetical protein